LNAPTKPAITDWVKNGAKNARQISKVNVISHKKWTRHTILGMLLRSSERGVVHRAGVELRNGEILQKERFDCAIRRAGAERQYMEAINEFSRLTIEAIQGRHVEHEWLSVHEIRH
jgi:hypothetical protein